MSLPTRPKASSSSSPPSASYLNHESGNRATGDRFLDQSRELRLTERDRQEGYDVELLNARPRGSNSHGSPLLGAPTTAGLSSSPSKTGGLSPSPSLRAIEGNDTLYGSRHFGSSAEYMPAAASAIGAGGALQQTTSIDMTNRRNLESFERHNGIALSNHGEKGASDSTFATGGDPGVVSDYDRRKGAGRDGKARQRPWYMKPLALALVIGTLLAIALAIGLGVGLSMRNSNRDNDNGQYLATGANYTSTRINTTRTSRKTTTGTVVPSSLFSQYSQSLSRSRSNACAAGECATLSSAPQATPLDPSSPTPTPTSPDSENKPIPVEQSTFTAGTSISAISPLGGFNRYRRDISPPSMANRTPAPRFPGPRRPTP